MKRAGKQVHARKKEGSVKREGKTGLSIEDATSLVVRSSPPDQNEDQGAVDPPPPPPKTTNKQKSIGRCSMMHRTEAHTGGRGIVV